MLRVSSGLCALSINNDNCYLAYPGSATIGEVQVFDTINLVRFSGARELSERTPHLQRGLRGLWRLWRVQFCLLAPHQRGAHPSVSSPRARAGRDGENFARHLGINGFTFLRF